MNSLFLLESVVGKVKVTSPLSLTLKQLSSEMESAEATPREERKTEEG